jgi:hypothetical protein
MHSITDVPLFIENNVGEMTPLCMSWADENEENDEDFILVESRKKKHNKKKVKVLLLLLVLLPGAKRLWYVKGINLPILLAEISMRENKILDINDRLLLE